MGKRKIKQIIAMIIVVVMMSSTGMFAVNAASPLIELGRLPIRIIFEETYGANVTWCDDERTIHIKLVGNVIVFHTRQPLVYVNDEAITLQYDIILWEGRSFISQYDLAMVMDDLQPIFDDAREMAADFMGHFIAGDIETILPAVSEGLQSAVAELHLLGAEGFAAMNLMALLQRGSFIDWEIAGYQAVQGFLVFDFAVSNTIGEGGYRVVINSAGEIDGFLDLGFVFEPILPNENAAYTAYPVIIGEGTAWELDGLLTMPNEASAENPVPAVVLVHGSGAQNMDTSVFDNRPFHDIATYLSSNGIAVLRYHKRTLVHGAELMQAYGDNFTVWEETIEDALLAAEILRADPRISSVFVAGNSQGGVLAPRIAEEGGLDGAILLAGSPRALFEISYDQNIQSISDLLSAELISQEQADMLFAMVDALLEEAKTLPNMTEEEMQGAMIFGLPAIWQRSFYDSLPLPIISRNAVPTLILHGDRDFQVWTDSDFNVFVEHTEGYAHVQTILYDGLTHIFTPAQTDFNDIREYMIAGHVDAQVLRDIVEWVLDNK